LLRSAHKGVLFLDEIGELGPDEQAMLLKAVEAKRFLPVGSDNEVQSDFQLIAGTNRDLAQDVVAGRFREDLYARINLLTYACPACATGRRISNRISTTCLPSSAKNMGRWCVSTARPVPVSCVLRARPRHFGRAISATCGRR
jgi:hypothetical protein